MSYILRLKCTIKGFIEMYKSLLYHTYMSKTKKTKKTKKGESLWDRFGHKGMHAPEYKDSVSYIRKQRDKE